MPLRGRVGRHAKQQGRHCQNWQEDQKVVIALLKRIAVSDGGADAPLDARIVNGMAGDALYKAISRFEDMHFPGQGSGYIDPGGAMLKKMEELAKKPVGVAGRYDRLRRLGLDDANWSPPPPDWDLGAIHRNLLNQLPYTIRDALEKGGRFSAVDRDALFVMAARQVKSLKDQNFRELPWLVAMFGRAYVFKSFRMLGYAQDDGSVSFLNLDTHEEEEPKLPIMRYGEPVDERGNSLITGKQDALLLYKNGAIRHIPPYHEFIVAQGIAPIAGYDRPRPIAGAGKFGIK